MAYGIIEYDIEGKPICEICGMGFHRVVSHVKQKHGILARDYKKQYGFNVKRGICSEVSKEKVRQKTLDNYDLVVSQNLIQHGKDSRFTKGYAGRTGEQLSEQARLMLIERCAMIVERKKKKP